MIETSTSLAALAAALAKAQAAVEGAIKGKVNPAFRSKYADLASVWDACREALTDNGLSVIQSPGHIEDGRMEMTTMLLHASGEWARGSLTIPVAKADAHGYGSAITYARRYALAAFVGVSPEDDDGNAAAGKKAAATDASDPPPGLVVKAASGRKSSAQAKRDGDDVRIKAEIGSCDAAGLFDWQDNFDNYTTTLPISWLDSVRDMMEHRMEELNGAASVASQEAELDAAFRGTVGGGVAGRNRDHPAP